MKNKIFLLLLFALIAASISGCAKSEIFVETQPDIVQSKSNDQGEQKNDTKIEEIELKNSQTVDGITIIINGFKIKPYKEFQKENFGSSAGLTYGNGETCSNVIEVSFTVENRTDSGFGYITSFDGTLSDGRPLKPCTDIADMDLHQVDSGYKKTDCAYFNADDIGDPNTINLTYDFMNYNQEYWDDFRKILNGEMSEQEYRNKYSSYKEISFVASKNE